MTAVLVELVAVMAVGVGLLAGAIVSLRVVLRRRQRREQRLRPPASQAIAQYVSGAGAGPAPSGDAERAMVRKVALAALIDLSGSERDDLVALMGRLGYLDDAMAGLTSRRRGVRRRAAELLAAAPTPAVVPALVAGLRDSDPLVRTSCARTLAQAGPEDVTPLIAATAEQDMRAAAGAAAAVVLALGRSRPAALTSLLGAESQVQVRAVAVTVAGRMRLAGLAPSLRSCLSGADGLAAKAAEGLGMIGDITAVGALRDLARDRKRALPARAAAIEALGAIGDPWSVPLLESLLRVADWPIRAAAAHALGRLGEPGAEGLRRGVSSGPAEVREQAEAVLPQ